MLNKAFELITSRVEKTLAQQGFSRQKVTSESENELTALYISENIAYNIIYYKDKMHMVLSSCPMTDEGPSNEWKKNATWIFDPQTHNMDDADSIANDFCETLTSAPAIKRIKQQKKVKKDDEGNADPMFFAKRLVALLPELKAEIKEENENYYPFRGVTFAREKIMPKLDEFLKRATQPEIDKLAGILSAQYRNGNADTRSIITMVILNYIDPQYHEALKKEMSEDLKKSWDAARRFKGKKVKPEKPKKVKKKRDSDAERLERRE